MLYTIYSICVWIKFGFVWVLQKRLFSRVAKLKEKIISNDKNSYITDSNLQTVSLNNKLSDDGSGELVDTIADKAITVEDRAIYKQQQKSFKIDVKLFETL